MDSDTKLCEKLYRAAETGEIKKVIEIVGSSPDIITCADKWGYTPLHGVVTRHGFITEDDQKLAQYLIDNGALVETKTDSGIMPLHITPYPEMVELLFKHGANLEVIDSSGSTAILFYAEDNNGPAALEKALELGANPNHRDKKVILH